MKKKIYSPFLVLYYILLGDIHCRFVGNPLQSQRMGCIQNYDEEKCIYEVECVGSLRDISYSHFERSNVNCVEMNCNGNYDLTPLKISFNDTLRNSEIICDESLIYCLTKELDLSFNNYNDIPNVGEMYNLKLLNVSHNNINVARLFDYNYELNALREIDFSYNEITQVEIDENYFIFRNLEKLWLSHNEIVQIPDTMFNSFINLEYLDLSYNSIVNVSLLTFEGLKRIQFLKLSYNGIADINSSLFRFNKLQELYLDNNKIQNILAQDFVKLTELEVIDLSHNSIVTLERNVFHTMRHLKTVNLSFNLLTNIDSNMYSSNLNLQAVDLSRNEITNLPPHLFHDKNLSYFSVKENSIEGSLERGMFDGLKFVTNLDLSQQNIAYIDNYAFFGIENVFEILLNNNLIQSLAEKSFKTLFKLERLDLSFNKITQIEFNKEDLLNLRSLKLHGNHIAQIKKTYLNDLYRLNFLDLSHNNLSRIESQSFKNLANVNNLLISKNPICGNLEANIFEGLNSVPFLDLSYTQLNIVKNYSFESMFKLYNLNISHSNISEVQYNSFSNTGNINVIDLSYNSIKFFHINSSHLSNIKQLLLNNNDLTFLQDDFIKGILSLNKIDLSHNFIEFVNVKVFEDQKHLRFIDLSYNSDIKIDFSFIRKAKELDTLILSGFFSNSTFKNIGDVSLTKLEFSNSNIKNISELSLSELRKLQFLKLNNNNVTRLQIGAFSNLTNIVEIDVSSNNINFIQPGVFKDNINLKILNISHNSLLKLSYGVLNGLLSLNTLDVSFNYLDSLETEQFVEVATLRELIVDHNRISDLSIEDFHGLNLKILSIGDNPLPCRTIINFKKSFGPTVIITAVKYDNVHEENAYGIKCNVNGDKKYLNTYIKERSQVDNINENILMEIRDVLLSFKDKNNIIGDDKNKNIKNIFNITELLESSHQNDINKLNNLSSITIKLHDEQINTNKLLERMLKVLVAMTQLNREINESSVQVKDNNVTSENLSNLINKMKQDLDNAMVFEREKIIGEIEDKILIINKRVDSLLTTTTALTPRNDKFTLSTQPKPSLFVETCVALILFISVSFVLFKIYKSRRYILRRRSITISTRQIADAMDTSNV